MTDRIAEMSREELQASLLGKEMECKAWKVQLICLESKLKDLEDIREAAAEHHLHREFHRTCSLCKALEIYSEKWGGKE